MKVKLGIESPKTQLSGQKSPFLLSLYLVAENRLLRETMVRLFQNRDGISVIGESCYSASVCGDIAASKCDVLLWDSPPATTVTTLIDELCENAPQTRIVLFGMDEDAGSFLRAVRSGVCGYILKEASSAEIIAAVRGVSKGEAVCPPRLCMTLFAYVSQQFRQRPETLDLQACLKFGLTYRQRQLAALVAKGLTNKEIAANLNISEFTVKNHLHRIMRQVDADSRYEAVDVIRSGGLLSNA